MTNSRNDAYSEGMRAAERAIAEGVPRWVVTSICTNGHFIDPLTGLPIMGLSAPPELAERQTLFARGFNDLIYSGIKSGIITVDFRPLLMTQNEIVRAALENKIGTLSAGNPRIQPTNGDFVLELRFPNPSAKTKPTWIGYQRRTGEKWPQFDTYNGPLDVAIGRDGRVLIFRTPSLFFTCDVATTQRLNSYPTWEAATRTKC